MEVLDRDHVATHGRDNKLHIWSLAPTRDSASTHVNTVSQAGPSIKHPQLPSTMIKSLPQPTAIFTMDVNALNYCRFSIRKEIRSSRPTLLVAVPHTLESAYIDVYQVFPDTGMFTRIAEAIGRPDLATNSALKQSREAITMAIHLLRTNDSDDGLALLAAYEDGSVALWRNESGTSPTWREAWRIKHHIETVLSLSVDAREKFAVSTGADDFLVRYQLDVQSTEQATGRVKSSTNGGRASGAIRSDGRIFATGGWDGRIRCHGCESLEQLAVLDFFKDTVQSIAFSPDLREPELESGEGKEADADAETEDEDDVWDIDAEERMQEAFQYIAAGSKDGRIALYNINFNRDDG